MQGEACVSATRSASGKRASSPPCVSISNVRFRPAAVRPAMDSAARAMRSRRSRRADSRAARAASASIAGFGPTRLTTKRVVGPIFAETRVSSRRPERNRFTASDDLELPRLNPGLALQRVHECADRPRIVHLHLTGHRPRALQAHGRVRDEDARRRSEIAATKLLTSCSTGRLSFRVFDDDVALLLLTSSRPVLTAGSPLPCFPTAPRRTAGSSANELSAMAMSILSSAVSTRAFTAGVGAIHVPVPVPHRHVRVLHPKLDDLVLLVDRPGFAELHAEHRGDDAESGRLAAALSFVFQRIPVRSLRRVRCSRAPPRAVR